jgi:hypothetical protein
MSESELIDLWIIHMDFNLRRRMRAANMDWSNVAYEPQTVLRLILITGLVVVIPLVVGSLWYFGSVRKAPDT